MKKIIVLQTKRDETRQKDFNAAVDELNAHLALGEECSIAIETFGGKQITIVDGYFDIRITDGHSLEAGPCKWYNKKMLDSLKIKY